MNPPQALEIDVIASTQTVILTWTWTNTLGNQPLEPTGFIIERKIGSDLYEVLTTAIDGDERSYDDVLSTPDAVRIFVDQETIYYRIQAYWITEA